jgi:hypothetical protein
VANELNKQQKITSRYWAEDTFSNFGTVFTWVGISDPTVLAENSFAYEMAGQLMMFQFYFEYTNAGTTNTAVSFPLPAGDDPTIVPKLGYVDGKSRVVAMGEAIFLSAIDGTPVTCKCWISKDVMENYTVHIEGVGTNVKAVMGCICYKAHEVS